jgi:plasmid stability protein
MTGMTITLKNVPPDLHRSLKECAKLHKRSLNQEAIHVLESSLMGDSARRTSLLQPPKLRSLGALKVFTKDLNARADYLMDRES